MTTINIYENNDGESLILKEDIHNELKEIKELLESLKQENKSLKKMIIDLKFSKCEKKNDDDKSVDRIEKIIEEKTKNITDNPNNVTATITETLQEMNKEKTNETKEKDTTHIKGLKKSVSEYKEILLSKLPQYTTSSAKEYKNKVQRKYTASDSNGRKKLLKSVYTLNDMVKDLELEKYHIKRYILEDLIKEGRVKFFKINKNASTSSRVYYQIVKSEDNTTSNHSRKIDALFTIPDSVTLLYNDLKLLKNGEIEYGTKTRKFVLKYNIYDIFYIKSLSDDNNFTMGDFFKLANKNDTWDKLSLYKLIYNLRENNDLQEIINRARKVFKQDMHFDAKGDILLINNTVTHIPLHQVQSWCSAYVNGNKSRDVFIWELQKRFQELNRDYIAIILYNNGNDELANLLKENKDDEVFIENNPSKRRNLIMNGGLI